MALTQITTGSIADDAVTTDKLANAINTARDANTAKTTNATHSGEVTGATALTIADNVVDEANLKVSNSPTNGYFLSAQSGNTGGLTWAAVNTDLSNDSSPQLGGDLDTNGNHILLDDSRQVKFGDDNDMQIYHTGGHGYIENGTGHLYVRGNGGQIILKPNSSENSVRCMPDGAVELYHNGTKKLETTSGGAEVFGELQMDDANSHIKLPDSARIDFGTGNDLRIYHDGSTNIIEGLDGIMSIRPKTGENGILLRNNGAVELYYDDAKKLETTSGGATVSGTTTITGELNLIDGSTNANKYIDCGLGDNNALYIRGTSGGDSNHEVLAYFTRNGAVSLYHDGTERFYTTSYGAALIGSLRSWGHVYPNANNDVDLGTDALRWRNIYSNDLHLSNEGGSNDVDGTWGSYTIQEGAEDLFLINKRTGKKYKFNLTEVS